MSLFTMTGSGLVEAGLARLSADLRSGRWHRDHAALALTELDLGYRLIIAAA
jgi:hypothetical protein